MRIGKAPLTFSHSHVRRHRGPVTAGIAFDKAGAEPQRHPLTLRLLPGREHGAALLGNPYDGRTLAAVIPAMEIMIGNTVKRVITDAGYRRHNTPVDAGVILPWARPVLVPADAELGHELGVEVRDALPDLRMELIKREEAPVAEPWPAQTARRLAQPLRTSPRRAGSSDARAGSRCRNARPAPGRCG